MSYDLEEINAKQIYNLGREYGCIDQANRAIVERQSFADFKKNTIDGILTRHETRPAFSALANFNFSRYILARAEGKTIHRDDEKVIDECSVGIRKQARGAYLPRQVLNPRIDRQKAQRMLTAGTDSAGGFTVADMTLASQFVEPLSPMTPIINLSTKLYPTSRFSIPEKKTRTVGYWTPETEAPDTEASIQFGEIQMIPRFLRNWRNYSRELLLESAIDVQEYVKSDLRDSINFSLEDSLLNADSIDAKPRGLAHNTDITKITHTAGSISYDDCRKVEQSVALGDTPQPYTWIVSGKTRRIMKKTKEMPDGGSLPIWQTGDKGNDVATFASVGSKSQPTVLEYRAFLSHYCADDDAYLGNWRELLLARFVGAENDSVLLNEAAIQGDVIDVLTDPYSLSIQGLIRVVVFLSAAFALRHSASICRLTA